MSTDAPDLPEVLETWIEGYLDDVRVALPGRIESYDASKRRATIQLLVPDTHITGDAELITAAISPLTDVPVALCGSGTIRVKFPIRSGDPCWVMFASSSIAQLKAAANMDVIDPADDRHHHIADAFAIPIPTITAIDADDDAMIEFTDSGLIKAGGDNALVTVTEFNQHVHTSAPPSNPTTIPVTPAIGTSKLRG